MCSFPFVVVFGQTNCLKKYYKLVKEASCPVEEAIVVVFEVKVCFIDFVYFRFFVKCTLHVRFELKGQTTMRITTNL